MTPDELQMILGRFDAVDGRLDKVDTRLSKLEDGQAEWRGAIKVIAFGLKFLGVGGVGALLLFLLAAASDVVGPVLNLPHPSP